MTEEEKAVKVAEAVSAHQEAIKSRKEAEIKKGFLNPFGEETNYKEFLEEVKKSKKSIAEYCKGHLEEDQIKWLEKDVELFNQSKNE